MGFSIPQRILLSISIIKIAEREDFLNQFKVYVKSFESSKNVTIYIVFNFLDYDELSVIVISNQVGSNYFSF